MGILSQHLFNDCASIYFGDESSEVGKLSNRLILLLRRWGLDKRDFSALANKVPVEYFQGILKNSIATHKYPVLNQLKVLKLLIDSNVLVSNSLSEDSKAWIEEIHELSKQYNAPLHFTPNMTGITYAIFWVKCNYLDKNTKLINDLNFDLKSEILRSFRSSREMITMGRSYYTSIDSLFYLYDDFNDRQIHRNHAMQMACAELTRRYEKVIMCTI